MSTDASGNYSLPSADIVNGQTADATPVQNNFDDLASGMTERLTKTGKTTPTANLPMGNFRHTGVGAASARTDYARADQVQDSSTQYALTTGDDTIVATLTPAVTAYAIGQTFHLKKNANANTGAVTLNINSVGAGAVTWPDGTALAAADLPANCMFSVTVQATTPVFHLMSVAYGDVVRKAGSQTITGAKTVSATLTMSAAAFNEAIRVDVASATTTDIGAAASNYVRITGTTTITGLGTVASGVRRHVVFADALTLTHNGTSLILPTGANITTAAGDTALFISEGSGNWRCQSYQKAAGTPLTLGITSATNSLSGDVAANNTSNYFDGPSVAVIAGATDLFATGTVTLKDTAGAAEWRVKLWDGTTVIASATAWSEPSHTTAVALSGRITSPAGNIRISARDATSTNGVICFNESGNSKDSTITIERRG